MQQHFSMTCNNTSVSTKVYKSPKVEWQYDETGNRKVIASKTIFNGDLLLVEHAMDLPPQYSKMWVKLDSTLYNALYPRTNAWTENENLHASADARWDESSEKIRRNAFGNQTSAVIGLLSTSFNHNPLWNAHCKQLPVTVSLDDRTRAPLSRFVIIEATTTIKPGEEVCICYTDDRSYADWIGEINGYMFDMYKNKNVSVFAREVCSRYINTDQFIKLVTRSELSKIGMYQLENSNYINITDRFINLADTHFKGNIHAFVSMFTTQLEQILDNDRIICIGGDEVLDHETLSNHILRHS